MVKITIVYENHQNPKKPELKTGHGFSAYIEFEDKKILFDTGWDAEKLLENCQILNINLKNLDGLIQKHSY